MHFETKAIRIQTEKSQHQEHSTPLFPTSSFTFSNAQEMADGFAGLNEKNIYSRFTNPNCREFEQKMASLEGTEGAFATASGMAAVFATLLTFLEAGDHVLASRALFGSSFQILSDTLPRYGIEYTFLDPVDYNQWDTEVRPNTKLLFIETPTNP
jgi:O-succinylhomoserine sulfhydrylase